MWTEISLKFTGKIKKEGDSTAIPLIYALYGDITTFSAALSCFIFTISSGVPKANAPVRHV
jgi:hypothetical protein